MPLPFINAVSFPIDGDGVTTSFDVDLRNLPDFVWSEGAPKVAPTGIYGSVSVTGSPSVTVTGASLNSGQVLSVTLNSAPHNGTLYTVDASLQFPTV